jgi:nucleotide-binding universal stress UspA family protein
MAAIDAKKIRRILVAIDSSKFASVVIEEAAKLATRLGSDVTILSVVNIAGLFATEGEVDSSEIDEQERDFLSLHKSLIERYFNHSAILIESKILHGDPAEKICEYAETIDADLVLVGTHGKGALTAAVLGSVSHKVADNCKRSVVVIKKPS